MREESFVEQLLPWELETWQQMDQKRPLEDRISTLGNIRRVKFIFEDGKWSRGEWSKETKFSFTRPESDEFPF